MAFDLARSASRGRGRRWHWSGRIFAALAIFVIGRWSMRALTAWATRGMRRVGVDDTLTRFLGNLLYIVLLVFLG